jgi:NAD+ synthase (glutamine-hydrolysing)
MSSPARPGEPPLAPLRAALCQMDSTVGDLQGNARRIREGIAAAREAEAAVVCFPELGLTGYPPEDLLLKEHFLRDAAAVLDELAADTRDIVAVVGTPERAEDVYNGAAILAAGRVVARYRKVFLPNYGVFDEQRYFQSGRGGGVFDLGGHRIGVTVCEDMWEPGPPASDEALAGATLLINISASPYHAGKGIERERMFAQRARDNHACVAFCAMVGGQDELVFDGHSFVMDHQGNTIARAAQFREQLLVCDVDLHSAAAGRLREAGHRPVVRRQTPQVEVLGRLELPGRSERAAQQASRTAAARERAGAEDTGERALAAIAGRAGVGQASSTGQVGKIAELLHPLEAEVYEALLLGLSDYVRKNSFDHVVLGLSGGIDSALVACLAVDALGAPRVTAVVMPSPYSSPGTQADARALAAALGVETLELPIEATMHAYADTLSGAFDGREADITEENVQARIRGNLLMALSNKFGWLVLTTGNKSEMSVGYSTLYGDLAGGLAVIKDVPKTLVYRLARWRNCDSAAGGGRLRAPIPDSIIERAPSAELRRDQRDDQTLPAYPVLDRILHGYIELDQGREELEAQGLPSEDIDRALRLVDLAEYKRRQAPPGIKVTTRAFGRDRRMPITNRYRS